MTRMDFSIILWETSEPKYTLKVDGQRQLDVPKSDGLRKLFYEMEKFARLRFKGELQHKKKLRGGGGRRMTIEVIPRRWLHSLDNYHTLYLVGMYVLFHPDAREILHQQFADLKGWGINELEEVSK